MNAMHGSAVTAAVHRRAPVPPRNGRGCCAKRRRTTPASAALGATPPPPSPFPAAATDDAPVLLPPELERAWTARAPTAWHPLDGPEAWQGTEDDAFQGASPLAALSRAQRLLLLSDGSVTRHLQIVLGAAGGGSSPSDRGGGGNGGNGNGGSSSSSSSSSSNKAKGGGSGVHVECLAMDLLLPPPDADATTTSPSSSPRSLPPPERDATALLRPPFLRRQVLLRAAPGAPVSGPPFAFRARPRGDDDGQGDDMTGGVPLVYAASWWNAADAAAFLGGDGAAERPIWAALTSGRMELHRRVLGVSRGANAALWSPASSSGGGARGLLGAEDDWAAGAGGLGVAGRREGRQGGAAPPRELWGRHYVFWAGGRPLTVIHEVFSPRLMAVVDASCGIGGGGR